MPDQQMDDDENRTNDDEIFQGEFVDEDSGAARRDGDLHPPVPLAPQETVLTPCHHGCTCGLHQQVVYGDRVEEHEPTLLDHGEMGLLTAAIRDVSRLLHQYHDHCARLRSAATRTHGDATRAQRALAVLLDSDTVRRGREERDRVDADYADLMPAERQPAPRLLVGALVFALVAVGIFDAVFFQQTFLDIMQSSVNDPFWKRDIGLLVAIVLAVGLVAGGRILTGPLWRLRHRWHRTASPDDPPLRRWARTGRVLATCAAPAALFFVLGLWASYRGQEGAAAIADPTSLVAVQPSSLAVMALILSLALTVVVLEVLVYNPYRADLKRTEKALAKVRKTIREGSDAASRAVDDHQIAWSNLRSGRDEIIAVVQMGLARPWETIILPARLRHGRAGSTAADAKPKPDVMIELVPDTDQVRISYQIFEGMVQPQPAPGPLAEVVRAVVEYDPQPLKNEQARLEKKMLEHLGEA
jgi:hypothetical protein